MPLYDFRCTQCTHVFEKRARYSDDPPPCPECGGAAQRMISAVAVHYKGGGFYATDRRSLGVDRNGRPRSVIEAGEDQSAF